MNVPIVGPLEQTLTLRQAKKLIQCMAHEQSFLLLAPPGVGKSDVVCQAAAEAGLPCRSLLGTQIAPEDVSGIPRIIGERSVFCPPRLLLPEDGRTILPVPRRAAGAPPDIQKAFYSLLLERRIGEFPLPAGSWVVAAGNRAAGPRAGAVVSARRWSTACSSAHRGRSQGMARLGQSAGVRSEILAFITYMPDALSGQCRASRCRFRRRGRGTRCRGRWTWSRLAGTLAGKPPRPGLRPRQRRRTPRSICALGRGRHRRPAADRGVHRGPRQAAAAGHRRAGSSCTAAAGSNAASCRSWIPGT